MAIENWIDGFDDQDWVDEILTRDFLLSARRQARSRLVNNALKSKPSPKGVSWPKKGPAVNYALVNDLVALCKVAYLYQCDEVIFDGNVGTGMRNEYFGRDLRQDIIALLKEHNNGRTGVS